MEGKEMNEIIERSIGLVLGFCVLVAVIAGYCPPMGVAFLTPFVLLLLFLGGMKVKKTYDIKDSIGSISRFCFRVTTVIYTAVMGYFLWDGSIFGEGKVFHGASVDGYINIAFILASLTVAALAFATPIRYALRRRPVKLFAAI